MYCLVISSLFLLPSVPFHSHRSTTIVGFICVINCVSNNKNLLSFTSDELAMPSQGRNYRRGGGGGSDHPLPRLYLVGYIYAISSGKLKKKFMCLGLERNSCRKTFDKFTKILLKNSKQAPPPSRNLVPRVSYEDEGKRRESPRLGIFDSDSSSSGEIFLTEFLTEIYKSSKQIESQKSMLFMYNDVWHEFAEISEETVDVF